jgi:multidrug efflux pump subunit AcrB
MPGEYDRYNMRRLVSMTANVYGEDLGRVANQITQAVQAAGEPPRGVQVDVRGQIEPMQQMFGGLAGGVKLPALLPTLANWNIEWSAWWRGWTNFFGEFFQGLTGGLCLAVVVILLLLAAYFQSVRLALVVVATAPAVVAGVALALWITGTTLNIQSFMGAIMAIGVATANAILLITFAERVRRSGAPAREAAVEGAQTRLRPILMTSFAMMAGMMPMALALGEGGQQVAPLGRAVIGGLAAATITTLLILPCVFVAVQGRSSSRSVSLDADDPESRHFDRAQTASPLAPDGTVLAVKPNISG